MNSPEPKVPAQAEIRCKAGEYTLYLLGVYLLARMAGLVIYITFGQNNKVVYMPKRAPKDLKKLAKAVNKLNGDIEKNGKLIEANGREIRALKMLCEKAFL